MWLTIDVFKIQRKSTITTNNYLRLMISTVQLKTINYKYIQIKNNYNIIPFRYYSLLTDTEI